MERFGGVNRFEWGFECVVSDETFCDFRSTKREFRFNPNVDNALNRAAALGPLENSIGQMRTPKFDLYAPSGTCRPTLTLSIATKVRKRLTLLLPKNSRLVRAS